MCLGCSDTSTAPYFRAKPWRQIVHCFFRVSAGQANSRDHPLAPPSQASNQIQLEPKWTLVWFLWHEKGSRCSPGERIGSDGPNQQKVRSWKHCRGDAKNEPSGPSAWQGDQGLYICHSIPWWPSPAVAHGISGPGPREISEPSFHQKLWS